MSIDAVITGILRTEHHTQLILVQPDKSRCAGQSCLTIEPPVPGEHTLGLLLNKSVWGGADKLMLGEVQIGTRLGYTRIKLDPKAIIKGVLEHGKTHQTTNAS